MNRLQEEFNSGTGDFCLPPGEYEGPLVISRPCTFDGGMSTLWAERGPVLTVTSGGVTIRNLRVEITSEERRTVIETHSPDTVLDQVEVNGDISGFPGEAEGWNLPPVISLGEFAANEVNSFAVQLVLPANASLTCTVKDLKASPTRLRRGDNRLVLETSALRSGTLLYGELLLHTCVTRRIYITGKPSDHAPIHLDAMPFSGTLPVSEPLKMNAPQEIIAPSPPGQEVRQAVRGQRLELNGGVLRLAYGCAGGRCPLEVDGYVFRLGADGKVRGDGDLIFFGNPVSDTGCVRVSAADEMPLILLEPEKIPGWVRTVAVCFSVYGDDPAENFSLASGPYLRIFAGETEFCRFKMDGLGTEKTVVALELYRYHEAWKLKFVGAGYQDGLETLCRRYGVDVE